MALAMTSCRTIARMIPPQGRCGDSVKNPTTRNIRSRFSLGEIGDALSLVNSQDNDLRWMALPGILVGQYHRVAVHGGAAEVLCTVGRLAEKSCSLPCMPGVTAGDSDPLGRDRLQELNGRGSASEPSVDLLGAVPG
jgi:hypothetical protein